MARMLAGLKAGTTGKVDEKFAAEREHGNPRDRFQRASNAQGRKRSRERATGGGPRDMPLSSFGSHLVFGLTTEVVRRTIPRIQAFGDSRDSRIQD